MIFIVPSKKSAVWESHIPKYDMHKPNVEPPWYLLRITKFHELAVTLVRRNSLISEYHFMGEKARFSFGNVTFRLHWHIM